MGFSDDRANAVLDSVLGSGTPSSLHIGLAAVTAPSNLSVQTTYNSAGDILRQQPGTPQISDRSPLLVDPGYFTTNGSTIVRIHNEVNLWGVNSVSMLNNASVWPAAASRSKSNAVAVTLPSFVVNPQPYSNYPIVCRHFVITNAAFSFTLVNNIWVTTYRPANLVAWGTLGYVYPAGIYGGTSTLVAFPIGSLVFSLP